VVLRALEKAPAARFQSMDEFSAALANPGAHLGTYEAQIASRAPAPAPASAGAVRAGATLALPAGTAQTVLEAAATLAAPTTETKSSTTTLSGAASEILEPEPRPWKPRILIAAAAGVMIAAGIIVLLLKTRTPEPARPPVVTAPAESAEIELAVRSDP